MRRRLLLAAAAAGLAVAAAAALYHQRVPHVRYRPAGVVADSSREPGREYAYSLAFIELTDQGYFWDPGQLDSLRAHVRSAGAPHGAIVVAYVHGWNHNADPADGNVACFRELLKAVALMQAGYAKGDPHGAPRVVGVYVGWRGLALQPGRLNQALTFWNRIDVADRVGGRGALLETLLALRQLRQEVDPRQRSKLVIVGHSMGARAVFTALNPFFSAAASDSAFGWNVRHGFGDLVVLVNPAFSATMYRVIDERAREAFRDARDSLPPNLLVASSSGDDVTRRLYPLAYQVSSFWQEFAPHESPLELRTTVGNHDAFVTHDLRVEQGAPPPFGADAAAAGRACHYFRAEDLSVVRGRERDPGGLAALRDYKRMVHAASSGTAGSTAAGPYTVVLEPRAGQPARGPYMVVRVDERIVPDHNQFYTSPFVDFLIRVVNAKAQVQRAAAARDRPAPPSR